VFEETPNVNMNPLPNHVLGKCNRGRMSGKPKSTDEKSRVQRRQRVFLRMSMIEDEVLP
jgi:hypothetical protein